MNNAYALRSPVFLTGRTFGLRFVRDASPQERKDRVDFHVASNDYFGTLATIMGLIADAVSRNDVVSRERGVRTLNELREDLTYLQETHLIRRK